MTTIEERPSISKAEEWAERIAAQQRSGTSVKQFCKDQGLTEYSFYAWRKRLQKKEPVRFALVDRERQGRSRRLKRSGTGIDDRRTVAHRRRSGCHYVALGPG